MKTAQGDINNSLMMMDINDSFIFKDSPFKDEKYQHQIIRDPLSEEIGNKNIFDDITPKQNFGVNDKNAKNIGDKLKML